MVDMRKWGALVVFAFQNAGAFLLMRYSKTLNAHAYNNLAAVLMTEIVKLAVSIILFTVECGGPFAMASAIRTDLSERSREWLSLLVPSMLYTVQNTCLLIGTANVEATIAQERECMHRL